jgi:hypothetical protein
LADRLDEPMGGCPPSLFGPLPSGVVVPLDFVQLTIQIRDLTRSGLKEQFFKYETAFSKIVGLGRKAFIG